MAPSLTSKITGFSITDLAIAAVPTVGNTTPTWYDVPLIEEAMFKLDVKQAELWGDDKYVDTFYHSPTGVITAKVNQMSLSILERLSGVDGVSSGDGAQQVYIGTQAELRPPRVMVRAKIPARFDDGTFGEEVIYWFKCSVTTLWDSSPGNSRGKIQEINWKINVFSSETDERGDALPAQCDGSAFGRMDVK